MCGIVRVTYTIKTTPFSMGGKVSPVHLNLFIMLKLKKKHKCNTTDGSNLYIHKFESSSGEKNKFGVIPNSITFNYTSQYDLPQQVGHVYDFEIVDLKEDFDFVTKTETWFDQNTQKQVTARVRRIYDKCPDVDAE
jgi:hypothetical protein